MNNALKDIKRVLTVLFGSFLSALAINELIIPHHLLSGGVSGISLIVQYLTGISAGALMLVINIPIFILGIREIDKDFIAYSFVGTVGLSVFLILLKSTNIFAGMRVDDIMLSSVFGGVLNGLGAGIVFRSRGSTGGADIIAVIVRKHRSLNIGTVSFLINAVIIFIASFMYGVKPALYTLVSMYLSSMVLDRVQEGFDRKKSVFIITEKEDEVSRAILDTLHRGVTFLYGEGAYTQNSRRILYCIITTKQLAKIKYIVHSIDKNAFLTVSDTSEVLGRGFENKGI